MLLSAVTDYQAILALSKAVFKDNMNIQAAAVVPHLDRLTTLAAAVTGLGTASYGIVDVTKSWNGGVSNRGFASIRKTLATLVPEKTPATATGGVSAASVVAPALSLNSMLVTVRSNWINGMASGDQVAIAKSLVKLRLAPDLVPGLATLTGVDPALLASVAGKLAGAQPLTKEESDVYGRFDLVLTTLLDQAYQRADQQYRNTAKLCALVAAVLLAVAGAWALGGIHSFFLLDQGFWQAMLVGLLATPLAPVAKDLSTAVQIRVRAAQS